MQGLSALRVAHCYPAFGGRSPIPSPAPRHRLLLLDFQQRCSFAQSGREALAPASVRRLKTSPQDGSATEDTLPPLPEKEVATELAEQGAPTDDGALEEGPKVTVKFVLEKKCYFGQRFNVAGSIPSLGSWDLKAAIPMDWSEGDIWAAEVDIPEGKEVEFKFVLTGEHGDIEWQAGANRTFSTVEGISPLVVNEAWKSSEVSAAVEVEGESSDLVEDNATSGLLVPADLTDDATAADEVVKALESRNGEDTTPKPEPETAPEIPVAELDVAAAAVKAVVGADDTA